MSDSSLHQILAVEKSLDSTAAKTLEEATSTFKSKPDHFLARHRKFEPDTDDLSLQEPEVHKSMVTTVDQKLDYLDDHLVRFWDAVAQKEATNQTARADIVVDGVTLASDVPATFLLGMESKLKRLRETYLQIPTLDPGIEWELDADKGEGVYKNAKLNQKIKTKEEIQFKILDKATKEHLAQIKTYSSAVRIGVFTDSVWSGMKSVHDKSQLLARLDNLIREVTKARMRANNAKVLPCEIGKDLLAYIRGTK